MALSLSSLSKRRRDEVQGDLAVLRTECDRGRVRPAVVVAVIDSVLEVMTPELPDGVARSLTEARPEPGPGRDPVEGPDEDQVSDLGPTCLT